MSMEYLKLLKQREKKVLLLSIEKFPYEEEQTMKKIGMVVCMAASIILALTACGKNEGETSKMESLVDKGNEEKLPECVPFMTDPKEFVKVKDNQDYNEQTDDEYTLSRIFAANDDYVFGVSGSQFAKVFDKETRTLAYLCNRPDCQHNSDECNAHLDDYSDIQYYDGDLYYNVTEYEMSGDEIINEQICLYKMDIESQEKEKVCELAKIHHADMVEMSGGAGINYNIVWTIHRGYVYFAYGIGTSGLKDNTMYNNMSNCVSRMRMDGTGERENLMLLKRNMVEAISFEGHGSYMYFMDPDVDADMDGDLYRYNTESNVVEQLPIDGIGPANYAIYENKIYHVKNNDSNLYVYDFDSMTDTVAADMTKYDTRYLQYLSVIRDEDYLYVSCMVDEKEQIYKCIVFDRDVNYVSRFDMAVDGDYNYIVRFVGDDVVFMTYIGLRKWYYFDKEELKTGDIHPIYIEGSENL